MNKRTNESLEAQKEALKRDFKGNIYWGNGELSINSEDFKTQVIGKQLNFYEFLSKFQYFWGDHSHRFENDYEGFDYLIDVEENNGFNAICKIGVVYRDENGTEELLGLSTIIEPQHLNIQDRTVYSILDYNNMFNPDFYDNKWVTNYKVDQIEKLLVESKGSFAMLAGEKIIKDDDTYGSPFIMTIQILGQHRHWVELDWPNVKFSWEKKFIWDKVYFECQFVYEHKGETYSIMITLCPRDYYSREAILKEISHSLKEFGKDHFKQFISLIDFNEVNYRKIPLAKAVATLEKTVHNFIAYACVNVNDERLFFDIDDIDNPKVLTIKIVENDMILSKVEIEP